MLAALDRYLADQIASAERLRLALRLERDGISAERHEEIRRMAAEHAARFRAARKPGDRSPLKRVKPQRRR